MYTTPTVTAQLARERSRDLIREAEARRAARAIRDQGVTDRHVQPLDGAVPERRRRTWWALARRTATA